MNHRGTETQRKDELTDKVIGAAIKVHRELGPGLLESVYEVCLAHELRELKLSVQRQVDLPVVYRGIRFDEGFKIDIMVEDKVVIELKTVEQLLPVHEAQLLTYLRMTSVHTGLLINFNQALLKEGIKRMVL